MGNHHQTPTRQIAGECRCALDIAASIASQGFEGLAIRIADAERAGRLPGPHRDPFDRMLIAQTQGHSLVIVSVDSAFDAYAVRRLW